MAPPKKRKHDQWSIKDMFGQSNDSDTASVSTDVDNESKQNVQIDLCVNQMKNANGIDWTILFDFNIHFIGSISQQVDSERNVEIESAPSSRSATPMNTDYDGEDSESDSVAVDSSEGWCESKMRTKHQKFVTEIEFCNFSLSYITFRSIVFNCGDIQITSWYRNFSKREAEKIYAM